MLYTIVSRAAEIQAQSLLNPVFLHGVAKRFDPMIRVLMADDDVESQQVMHDAIEVTFSEVEVESVTNRENLNKKLAKNGNEYYLLLIDYHLHDAPRGENEYDFLRTHFPHLIRKTILINDTGETLDNSSFPDDILVIDRPFSLDGFKEIIKEYSER